MFLEISQNSQEKTCAKASFLIKRFSKFNEKETLGTGVSKNNVFTEHLRWLFLTGVLNYSENFAKFPRTHSCWSSLLDVCWRPAFLLKANFTSYVFCGFSTSFREVFLRTPVKKCFYPLTVIVDALQNFCDVFHCVAHKLCHITLREVTCR